jgi:hypothetical protein
VSNSVFRPLYQFTTHASDDTFEKMELRMVLVGDRTPPLSCLRPPPVPKAYQIPANMLLFPLTNLI